MNFVYRLSFLFIALLIYYPSSLAETPPTCYIGDIEATVLPCDEAGNFSVLIDFEYENVGDNFKVQGNGTVYGIFLYTELPVTIGPLEGDGVTIYEFVVRDMQHPDCTNWTEIDPVDCEGTGGECYIHDLIVDDNPCNDDGYFTVYLDFEYENVSEDGFKLYVNDDFLGIHDYEDLPLTEVGPFEGDGVTVYHFLVRDAVYEGCAEDEDLGPIDCDGGGGEECELDDMEVEVLPCNDDGFFMAEIDFEYENTSEAFHLWVNNEIWADYAYASLPVTVGPLEGDGETVWFFVAADVVHDNCATNTHIEPVDCEGGGGGDCSIHDVEATVLPCNEAGYFYVLLDFEYQNVGELGFKVVGNGTNYGNFEYGDLPVELGPLLGDGTTIYEFEARDKTYDDCYDYTEIDPVDCGSAPILNNLTTEIISCDNELFQMEVNFDITGSVSEGFSISGNGNDYGSFDYSQLPIVVGPLSADGITEYYFIVRDEGQVPYGNWNKLTPFTCEDMGLDENGLGSNFVVYFNHGKHTLVILNKEVTGGYAEIRVFDLYGRQIASKEILGSTTYLRLPETYAGTAVWMISSGTEKYRGKIIVK